MIAATVSGSLYEFIRTWPKFVSQNPPARTEKTDPPLLSSSVREQRERSDCIVIRLGPQVDPVLDLEALRGPIDKVAVFLYTSTVKAHTCIRYVRQYRVFTVVYGARVPVTVRLYKYARHMSLYMLRTYVTPTYLRMCGRMQPVDGTAKGVGY